MAMEKIGRIGPGRWHKALVALIPKVMKLSAVVVQIYTRI
jgi:hypothetical protein